MRDAPDAAPMSDRDRRRALYVLCLGVLMIVLDATVVNVALPSIKEDLGFTDSGLAWVVNAYLIAFGGLLLLAGRLGDLVSRRGVFLAGLAVFLVASVACGLAQSQEMLVVARFVQGAGGAAASAVVLGMIVTMFPEPREQAKAIGVYAFVASAGGSVGLLAGGVLTQAINWHWIFFINLPIGLATGFYARRLLHHDRGTGLDRRVDALGALLVTSSLMLLVFTIVDPAAEEGWGSTTTLRFAAGALVLLVAFVVREATARQPLVPLRIFRSRAISGANTVQVLMVAGMFALFFLGALFLQQVLRYDALETGLAFLPATLIMGALSMWLSEHVISRFGARRTLIAGQMLLAGSLAFFTRSPEDARYVLDVMPTMVLLGLGAGLAFPALMGIAMADATPADAGLASGLVNTTAQVGGAVGLAVFATLAANETEERRAAGASLDVALNAGYHLAYAVGAALIALSLLVSLFVLRDTPAAPAGEPEALLDGDRDAETLVGPTRREHPDPARGLEGAELARWRSVAGRSGRLSFVHESNRGGRWGRRTTSRGGT